MDYLLNNILIFAGNNPELMYFFAFFFSAAEGTFFLSWMPGSTFTFSVGMIAATGKLSIEFLFIVVIIGAFVGDGIGYFLGKYFGKRILDSGMIEKKYYSFAQFFIVEHGRKSIFFSRFIAGLKELAPFMAGVLNMKKTTFFIWNFLGCFAWAIIWLGSGYLIGGHLTSVTDFLRVITIFGLISFSLFVFSFYIKHKYYFKDKNIKINYEQKNNKK